AYEINDKRGEQEEEAAEDEIFSHKTSCYKVFEPRTHYGPRINSNVTSLLYLGKIRDDVTQRSLIAKRQMELKDMSIEDEVPDIGDIGVQLGKLFAPRRPLRPVRKERKVVGAQNLTVSDVKVFINVVRALDIPVRDDVQPAGHKSVHSWRQFFQGQVDSTTVADGPNPSWNEEIIIPFRAPNNDYSPETLQTVNDVVYLNLFDEVVFNILQDDRQQSTNIHQRLERHWLGSIEIPFSTIYFNNK
ncbi:Coiled-coil and C2 domain-containing protein 2A, partial [Desmophyllum pertusum]